MTTKAAYAGEAFRIGRRRRAARSIVESAADGAIAGGGLLLANAASQMGLGLPEGALGLSLGTGLLSLGIAWLARHRRSPSRPERARPALVRMPLRTASVTARAVAISEAA